MNNSGLLPNPTLLHLDRVIAHQTAITVLATTMPPHACCPVCQHRSTRVHSRYQRTLADVPWHGVAVRLQLHTRRFFCNNPTCSRAIFTEPLPGVAERYTRRTGRLHETFHLIGLMVGGEAGARLAQELGMCSSPDTLLRLLRRAITRVHPTPRILGVDDWAFRKGQHYGTILCDLQQRRVIDLLPERSAASLAQWLRAHPGVEIISRDRSPLYTEGATTGAPTAIQVADRWHLLKNLREALERLLDRRHSSLGRAAREVEQQLMTAVTTAVQQWGDEHLGDGHYQVADGQLLTRSERLSQQRRDKRQVRYQEAMTLYAQGVPIRTIAQRLGNAILAALSLPWSNGQVEGRVNRLKLVKRQMYGRANFDLLRVRVLAAV